MRVRYLAVVVGAIAVGVGPSSAQPWEIGITGGYLSGGRITTSAAKADQFRDRPVAGVQDFLSYDLEGESPLVGWGDGRKWEFLMSGPELRIRAAEGKWKGYYLRKSERAFKDGASVGYLLELGKEPEVFNVYQVGR